MNDSVTPTPAVGDVAPVIGALAILIGIISAIGVVLLIAMYILFARSQMQLGQRVGHLNDICVGIQYLLTVPVALALYPILKGYNPALIRTATIVGIVSMLLVTALQLLLILGVIPFERQVLLVTPAMILGVGFWLIVSGLAARPISWLPRSVLMSSLAVPYIGYPVWAFWLGLHLLRR